MWNFCEQSQIQKSFFICTAIKEMRHIRKVLPVLSEYYNVNNSWTDIDEIWYEIYAIRSHSKLKVFLYARLATFFHADSNLKVETICSSETSVDCQRTARRYIPEDSSTIHNHRCGNLKSYICLYSR
jgi:hypothetical protein